MSRVTELRSSLVAAITAQAEIVAAAMAAGFIVRVDDKQNPSNGVIQFEKYADDGIATKGQFRVTIDTINQTASMQHGTKEGSTPVDISQLKPSDKNYFEEVFGLLEGAKIEALKQKQIDEKWKQSPQYQEFLKQQGGDAESVEEPAKEPAKEQPAANAGESKKAKKGSK